MSSSPDGAYDPNESLRSRFDRLHAQRATRLQWIARWSALTDPTILPSNYGPESRQSDDPLLTAFQSLGGSGLENLVGKTMFALFPPSLPWFRFEPTVDMKWQLSPGEYHLWENILYAREIQTYEHLESTNYRSAYRQAVANLLVAGDALAHENDEYRFANHRVDRFVVQRDSTKRVYRVMVFDSKRVEALDDETLKEFGTTRKALAAGADSNGRVGLVTEARLSDGRWVIRQELAGKYSAAPSEETLSPYFPAGYIEVDGEDYARSFIELRAGDLRSLNALAKAILDGAVAASRLLLAYDSSKGWRKDHLLQPNGTPIEGRVAGGQIDGVAFLQSNKAQDLSVALQLHDRIERRLSQAMLQVSSAVRDAERVTAQEYAGLQQELNGALGGLYIKIAEEIQSPLLARHVYQMERDNLLIALNEQQRRGMRMVPVTGMAALSRDAELSRWLRGLQYLAQIPQALEQMHLDRLATRILQLMTLDATGIAKTPEELKAEYDERMRRELTQEAGSTAIKTIGEMVQQQAAQRPPADAA